MALVAKHHNDLIAANPEPAHTGVFLPAKPKTADAFFNDHKSRFGGVEITEKAREIYEKELSGGPQSFTDRTVRIYVEGTDECMSIGAKTSTKVSEVRDLLAMFLQTDPTSITIKRKTLKGATVQKLNEECASTIFVGGVKTFQRKPHHWDHPILVIGAGLGGIQCMIDLHLKDRWDIVCMDRHHDFGGHSWIKVPNKFTKLQTERGTYSVEYPLPWAPVPKMIGDMEYKTWPTRDLLLAMMREGAKTHGLYDHVRFNTHIERVVPKAGNYAIQYMPMNEDEGDADIMLAGYVSTWPGFLHEPNRADFPGEEDFGGYIEYSSFDNVDYDMTVQKVCMLYGHGAFTIENVRTLCEHRCKKCWVLCRTRNLSGTKMASWLVGALTRPLPALVLLDAFKRMYDLVGYDVWTCYSVKQDGERSFASIEQKTIFGVTDIYFLAGYYQLMECVVDELKRLTHQTVHTKNGQKIYTEVFIKAIGTRPSFRVDKEHGLKELVGYWVNGDPRRPIQTGTKGVQAKNFGSFSVGPGFAPMVKILNYFCEYPDDWWAVKDKLPTNKAGVWPCYVTNAAYGLPVFMGLNSTLPMLAQQCNEMDQIKARKQNDAHPLPEYLSQCRKEWETYIKFFRENNMVDDRPDPPYPYTEEVIAYLVAKADRMHAGEKVYAD
mmetsp:Transcript_20115/g.47091  ORF Transcript_20115/g.47091 Transcript_20115/m.47091 type:complete len:662 (+) Transcript_20115:58-2043(+)